MFWVLSKIQGFAIAFMKEGNISNLSNRTRILIATLNQIIRIKAYWDSVF